MEIELSDARMFVARLDAPPPWPRIGARLGSDWPPGWLLAGWHKKMAVSLEGFSMTTDVHVAVAPDRVPHEALVGIEGSTGDEYGLRIFFHRLRRSLAPVGFGGRLLPRGITDDECAGAGITTEDTDAYGCVTWIACRREPRDGRAEWCSVS